LTLAAAGALAAALAVSCAFFVPFARGGLSLALRLRHPDRQALEEAGWPHSLSRWEWFRVGCVVAGVIVALAARAPLLVMVVAAAVAPSLLLRSRAAASRARARRSTTRLLRSTEAALRSGTSLPEALRRACDAATEDEFARRPFVTAIRAFDLGAPLDHALHESAERTLERRARLALETIAMGITSRLSYERAAALVGSVADRLAFDERLDEEIRARTAGLRSQLVLLALVVPAIAVYLALTVPSLAVTLGQPIGRFVLIPGAVALEAIGFIASRRAIDGVDR
jgi:tight adherence protein B